MREVKIEKLEGLRLFQENGIPILPFEFLSEKTLEVQIKDFTKKHKLSKFLIRTAGVIPKFHGTPSINNATLEKDRDRIKDFFEKGFIVLVMHPGNIHRDFHSLNIMKINEEVIIEVVGPGFIAPDLNRHGNVHEELILDTKTLRIVHSKILVSEEKYRKKVYAKMSQFDIKELRQEKSYLLEHDKYMPLSDDELAYIRKVFKKLQKIGNQLGFDNFIASMSFVDLGDGKNRPVFWDIYGIK